MELGCSVFGVQGEHMLYRWGTVRVCVVKIGCGLGCRDGVL